MGSQDILGLVEREESFAVGSLADDDASSDFCGIECVERLSEFVENEVRNIYDVIDWAQADRLKALLQPRW